MTTNNSLIVSNQAMMVGSQEDIQRAANRIKLMVKGGSKLNNNEAMALAQISFVTGLNPYIGELWYIPGKGPMVGIAGARRLDNERAENKGGYTWETYDSVPPEEAGASHEEIERVAAAFKCTIHDSVAIAQYQKLFADTLKMLREAGTSDPFAEAKEICGNRPEWVGYGFALRNESSTMSKVQLARKRAHADGLKKRIVIPFGGEVAETDSVPADVEAEALEMEYPQVEDGILAGLGEQESELPIKQAKPRLEGDDTMLVTVLAAETLDKLVEIEIFEHPKAAAQVVSRLFNKTQKAPFKKIVELSRAYRGHKDSGKSTDDAIEATLAA